MFYHLANGSIHIRNQRNLATTEQGDLIIDPCAGSFVVLEVCQELDRKFLGCDLTFKEMKEFLTKK